MIGSANSVCTENFSLRCINRVHNALINFHVVQISKTFYCT